MDDRFWRPEDLAFTLSVTKDVLRQWREKGLGPRWVRIGRQIRYDPGAVRDWIRKHEKGARHG